MSDSGRRDADAIGTVVVCHETSRTFGRGANAVVAVHGISCAASRGDRIVIVGPSGSGKSTLVHLLAGIDAPTTGTVRWPGISGALRPGPVSTVFQAPSLMPALDVAENTALPLVLAGVAANTARIAALDALANVGLASLASRLPEELSGGQAQRVAVARALVTDPILILADEPTGQLDRPTAAMVIAALLAAADRCDATLVIATHDRAVADRLQMRWLMTDGQLRILDREGRVSELRWVIAVARKQPGRLLAVAAGIAVAVALISSIGTFVRDARQTMTSRSISQVAVDWQIEAQPGADPAAVLDQVRRTAGVVNAAPIAFATTPGLEAAVDGASQTTGPGVVAGLPVDYAQQFPGSIRVIAGAADGVVLPQQTAANLHAAPGSIVHIQRAGLDDLAVTVTGIVELQQADSLFQRIGQPPTAQPQAPPDNVVLLPLDLWHHAFDALTIQRPELVHQEVHARLDRRLPDDPAAALDAVQGAAHHLDVTLAGSGIVADNLAASLDAARSDALYAQVLFLFLGLPGACIACVLAAALTTVPGMSRRHEQALLRAHGATASRLIRFAAAEGAIVGAVGAAAGILLGVVADQYLGSGRFDLAWNTASAVGGIVIAVAVLTTSAWRDARQLTVTSARQSKPHRWQRTTVAVIGIALGLVGLWVYAATRRRGYTLVFAPEGVPTISVSYWALLGPAALWIAAALLTHELAAVVLDRGRRVLGRAARPVAGSLAPTVAATMRRQRMSIARTLMLIALTIAFAASTAAFNQTYQHQADIDAKLTNGADVTATSATDAGFAPAVATQLASVPGVAHIEPLQHRYAYVGADVQDLFGVRAATIVDATHLQDTYFTGGTARDVVGRLNSTRDGVLVSAETVHDFQLQMGDQVLLRVQTDANGAPLTVPFHYVGIVNEFPTTPRDSFVVANADYLTNATGHDGTDTYLLDTAGTSPATVADAVRALTGTAAVVTDITTSRRVVGSTLTAIDLTGLARIELAYALLLIVGAAGLAFAFGLTERRRSFAIATALGATRKQVGGFVWTEATFVTIAGIGAGLLIAWLISNVLVTALAGVFDPSPQGPVVPSAYLTAIVACAAIAVTVSTTLTSRLARRSPISMLRAT